jgi:hypothetical protein
MCVSRQPLRADQLMTTESESRAPTIRFDLLPVYVLASAYRACVPRMHAWQPRVPGCIFFFCLFVFFSLTRPPTGSRITCSLDRRTNVRRNSCAIRGRRTFRFLMPRANFSFTGYGRGSSGVYNSYYVCCTWYSQVNSVIVPVIMMAAWHSDHDRAYCQLI